MGKNPAYRLGMPVPACHWFASGLRLYGSTKCLPAHKRPIASLPLKAESLSNTTAASITCHWRIAAIRTLIPLDKDRLLKPKFSKLRHYHPMSNKQSFFRYVVDRYHGRLSAAMHRAVKTFILFTSLLSSIGQEYTTAKILLGATFSLLPCLIWIAKAIFDSMFEAVGFLLGNLLLPLHLVIRIIIGLTALILVCFSMMEHSGWFIMSCIAVFVADLLPAFFARTLRELRLLAASVRAYSIIAVTLWACQAGFLYAILGFWLTYRAFYFFNEGMTICAAAQAQALRDYRTKALFIAITTQQMKQHPRERIILYLRPFTLTNRIKMDDGDFIEIAEETGLIAAHDSKENELSITFFSANIGIEKPSIFELGSDLEAVIAQAMSGAGHFIAFGNPGEAIGAGRLPLSESEWYENAKLMIDEATLCIVIPSAHSGTRLEIKYLSDNDLLSKCCILMPPTIGKFSYETEWRDARTALTEILPLPEYQKSGGLFRLNSRTLTELPKIEPIPKGLAENFALCVQSLFPELPKWKVDSRWDLTYSFIPDTRIIGTIKK